MSFDFADILFEAFVNTMQGVNMAAARNEASDEKQHERR